jgi:hypothetical protein
MKSLLEEDDVETELITSISRWDEEGFVRVTKSQVYVKSYYLLTGSANSFKTRPKKLGRIAHQTKGSEVSSHRNHF